MTTNRKPRIAIACQGGGSHTAFTAGALTRILKQHGDGFDIVALSGTSGGAICAFLTWYGLLHGDKQEAENRLIGFWNDNAANDVWDSLVNDIMVWAARWRHALPFPEISPYDLPTIGQDKLRALLKRHADFTQIEMLVADDSPGLIVGAVDVLSGGFKSFHGRQVTLDAILASTAIPTLFRAVHVNGSVYWDGLFSQNPPIRDLTDFRPDEIWVIQINPQRRRREPKSVEDISDRRNELSGNLSLEQEIHFIEKINELVDQELLKTDKYKHITIERIVIERDLEYFSKIDRSPELVKDLIDHGADQADRFLQQRSAILAPT
ncbi:MAG: patatin-like phospholipase family protein [Gammaproteobacteria bacterium]|nr:patatin-like phospholipase family protein [Gammaproteobacteria bacterium]